MFHKQGKVVNSFSPETPTVEKEALLPGARASRPPRERSERPSQGNQQVVRHWSGSLRSPGGRDARAPGSNASFFPAVPGEKLLTEK